MKSRSLVSPVLALAAVAALSAAPARADEPRLDPARSEVTVFGGISILDARTSQQQTFTWPTIPGLPGWPGGGTGDIQVTTQTKLGNSGLVGFRYSFYLRKQLALEVDAAVAPGQDLRSSVDLCGSGACYGRGDYGRAGTGPAFDAAMNAFFGGPVGRGFRGMVRMHGGEGGFDGDHGFGGRSLTAWHYGAGLTYDILGKDVRPFVALGAGGVSYDGSSTAKTDFALRFGAGVKVYFGRLGARVDAMDYVVFDNFLSGKTEHDLHITGGALVRF